MKNMIDINWVEFARSVLGAKAEDESVAKSAELLGAYFQNQSVESEMRAWDLYASACIAMAAHFTDEADEIHTQAAIMADRMMGERKKRVAKLREIWFGTGRVKQ